MVCETCGKTLYWCTGHGPAASGGGVPVVAAYAGAPNHTNGSES